MFKLLLLTVVGVLALGAYNYSTGRDLLHLPGTRTLQNTLGETATDTVRDGVRHAAREASAEVKERAAAGVHTVASRAEKAVTAAALTSKIKAKMALDDLVKAADIDVDTDGTVVTLTGEVRSEDERRRAVRIATETAGVTRVVNHLKVS
jgi:osmotically-inducible protein OsmY